jgi:hypothetical protein
LCEVAHTYPRFAHPAVVVIAKSPHFDNGTDIALSSNQPILRVEVMKRLIMGNTAKMILSRIQSAALAVKSKDFASSVTREE